MVPNHVIQLLLSRPRLRGNKSILKKVTTGYNSFKDCWNGCQYTMHAEMDAIRKLDKLYKYRSKRKKNINLIVIRVGKKGSLKDSKPCGKCLESLYRLKTFRVKYIYYSTNDEQIVKAKFNDLYNRRKEYYTKHTLIINGGNLLGNVST